MAKCGCVDTLHPTPILRPVCCYTVLSSARSGIRGTQQPERPATIVHCTVPYPGAENACASSCLLLPHPPSFLCMCLHTCIDVRALMRVWSLTCTVPVLLSIHLPVLSTIIVRDWSPCTIILSLRYVHSQVSSIHFPYHVVSNLPRAKSSQQLELARTRAGNWTMECSGSCGNCSE